MHAWYEFHPANGFSKNMTPFFLAQGQYLWDLCLCMYAAVPELRLV